MIDRYEVADVAASRSGRWVFSRPLRLILAGLLMLVVPRIAGADMPSGAKSGYGDAPQTAGRIFLPVSELYDPARIGVATFRCGGYGTVVLATPLKIDDKTVETGLGAGPVHVIALPQATVLHMPLPANEMIQVKAAGTGFALMRVSRERHGFARIQPALADGDVTFRASKPGKVVSITDPCLGGPLLVGTVLDDERLDARLQGPGYATVPAERGVVVHAVSDQLELAAAHHRFSLRSVGGPALPVGSPPARAAALEAVQRGPWKEFPRGNLRFLRRHLASVMREEASAPPLARSKAALRVARAMLSLGMGAETEGVLSDMLRHDPASVSDPARETALAIAEILTHRPDRALAALQDPVSAGPKAAADHLWRGLAFAEQGGSPRAAPLIAMGVDTLLAAPRYLRASLAPLAAETLVAGGELDAARRIFAAMPHARSLRLAEAEAAEANGDSHAALAALEKLSDSVNNRVAGIAAFRAIMLRYKLHKVTAKDAVTALSKALYLWRGPAHELTVRMALARLQARAGDWAQAMQSLRHARERFPFGRQEVEKERRKLFDRLLASGRLKTMQPLQAVAILQNNKDLFPPGKTRAKLLNLYADRLASLDLNDEARRVRAKARALMQSPPSQSPVLADAGIGALTAGGDDGRRPGKAPIVQPLSSDNEKTLASKMLDAKSAEHVLAEAKKAAAAGDQARLRELRKKYRKRVPKGLDRALFDAATAPPVGPDPKLDAALRQIATIENLSVALGKSDGQGKGTGDQSGDKTSTLSPQASGSSGS